MIIKSIYLVLALMLQGFIASTQSPNHSFSAADSVADRYHGHGLTNFRLLARKLTLNLEGDSAKARAIYRWICTNISNDFSFFKQVTRMKAKWGLTSPEYKEWSTKKLPVLMHHLIKKKKTICNGYTYLFRELAFHAGLEVKTMDGYSRTPYVNIGKEAPVVNHSWNAIRISDSWHYIDPTWGSGYIDERGAFQFQFNPAHFLTDPAIFAKTHYPIEALHPPPSLPLQDYLDSPLAFSMGTQFNLLAMSPDKYAVQLSKGQVLTFVVKVKGEKTFEAAYLQITKGGDLKDKLELQEALREGDYLLSEEWTAGLRGTYVIDLIIAGMVCYRWQVLVS